MSFKFKKNNAISGIILIENQVFSDERGFFTETYKASEFLNNSIVDKFVQENHSRSKKGVLRGLHYQKNPMAQDKLVRCVRGSIFDVAVDIRKGSPTYGNWAGFFLSENNKDMLYIPRGFAHGFCAIEDDSEIIYKCTNEYSPENEAGIIWNDPSIAINWPIGNPILSEKDLKYPLLEKADNNFIYEK